MNQILSNGPSIKAATKASIVINILVFAMLIPVVLIAWACSKIYSPRAPR